MTRSTPTRRAATERPVPPHRVVTTVVALGVPLLTTAIVLAVAHLWRADLPEQLVTGWGPDGPRETAGFAATVWPLAAMTLVMATGMWAAGFFWGHSAMTRRFATGAAVWLGTFVPGLLLATLAVQRGLPAGGEPTADGRFVWAVAVPFVLALVTAWLVPGDPPQPARRPVPSDAPRLPLGEAEQAAWVGTVEQASWPVILGGCALLTAVVGTASGQWWLALTIAVPLAALLVIMTRWTVTVSRDGLSARGALPRPRLLVPLDEIESAEVGTVRAVRDFGGWGLRLASGGRTGLILRSGEAIVVRRTGGRVVLVTIDDAATAVALLNALAARAR